MDWIWVLLIAVRSVSSAPEDVWANRLAELDHAREAAFAAADAARMDEVYITGSSGQRADTATIKAYARRGGQVVGARLAVLSCRVIEASGGRARLEVIDRLGPAQVRWDDGSTTKLPRDLPSRRHLTVVRTEDGWRISDARLVTLRR